METFTYKPAALAKNTTVVVDNDGASSKDEQFLWNRLETVQWSEYNLKGYFTRTLTLAFGDKKFFLSHTCSQGFDRSTKDFACFIQLVNTTLNIISNRTEIDTITLSHAKGLLWSLFIIGIVAVLGGTGILVGAILSNMSMNKLMGGLPMILTLIGTGIFLIRGFNPFVLDNKVPIEEFASQLISRNISTHHVS